MFTYEELKRIENYFNEPENKDKLRLELLYALAKNDEKIHFRFDYRNYGIIITFNNQKNTFEDGENLLFVNEKSDFIPSLNLMLTNIEGYIDEHARFD